MILYKEPSWWAWAVTALLLAAGLAGWAEAFALAALLSAMQVVHFRLRDGHWASFPVQVRLVYTCVVLLALWPPLNGLFWLIAAGTAAQVLLGYCALARCLSLLPWNRGESLSWRLVRKTFLAPPVKGNILQGLPPSR